MSTAAPQTGEPETKHHNPWPWIALVIAVVAIGLLVWALTLRSDRDDAQDEAQANAAVATGLRAINDELGAELGVTSDDLQAAEQDVTEAEQDRQEAESQAEAAAQKSADAQAQADEAADRAASAQQDSAQSAAQVEAAQAQAQAAAAQAQADEAKAQTDAADARRTIVADCAKSYAAALDGILATDDHRAALDAAKAQIADITDTCQAALNNQ